jgi:alkanesulfonate monooxygenase SsuD/methylene tetrahydromethanopterin reductase-like flavin-dependent oxidoreductase (luciferase family)
MLDVSIIAQDEIVYGLQLPVQAQSTMFVADWERACGPDALIAMARAADRSGFFYVAACDHIAIPARLASAMGTTWYDPIATLSLLAGVTTRVRLMTHVWVAAYRHPLLAAKTLATLDHLSKGRLIIGVGAGHVPEEFAALGLDFSRRRAGQRGVGWLPQGTPRAGMPGQIASLLSHREAAGMTDRIDIGAICEPIYVGEPDWDVGRGVLRGSADRIASSLNEFGAMGVNHLQVRFRSRSLDEQLDQMEAFGTMVGPLLKV